MIPFCVEQFHAAPPWLGKEPLTIGVADSPGMRVPCLRVSANPLRDDRFGATAMSQKGR